MLMTLFASACSNQAAVENTASINTQATTVKQNQPAPEIVAVNKLIDEIEPQVVGWVSNPPQRRQALIDYFRQPEKGK